MTLLPAGGAGAINVTNLYAFSSGSGSGCTTLADDCSLADALAAVAPSSTTNILLESVGAAAGNVFEAPTSGWSLDASGATVTIEPDPGLGGGQSYLDGVAITATAPILYIVDASTVTLADLAFQNGTSSVYGGAVNDGTESAGAALTVTDCLFNGNQADDGGAIDVGDTHGSGTLTVSGSTFENGYANEGGAIDLGDIDGSATATVTNSTFIDNSAIDGGAIDVGDNGGTGTLTVSGSTFTGGHGSRNGGAIDSGDATGSGTVTVTNSTFTGNSTGNGDGGAIDSGDDENNTSLSTGVLSVTDSILSNNTAFNTGGAIDNGDGSHGALTVTDSTLNNDTSTTGAGGAIDTSDGTGASGSATITGSTFEYDRGGDYGGAIANADDFGVGTLSVADSVFSHDVSTANGLGGGAIANGTYNGLGTLDVTGSTFEENGATNDVGGAIANGTHDGGSGRSSASVDASTFTGNSGYDGGAIANGESGSGLVTLAYSTFSANAAEDFGNAVANGVGGAPTTTVAVLNRDTIDNGASSNWAVYTHQLTYFAGTVVAGSDVTLCNASGPHANLISLGYNAEEDHFSCRFTATGDLQGISPGLGALADNGGPTLTELPAETSPLAGAIPSGATATGSIRVTICASPDSDQRGATQSAGAPCSIGAVDVALYPGPPRNLVLTPTTTTVTATWLAPTAGATPTGYVCTLLYGFNEPSTFTATVTSPSCAFSGLAPSTDYGVQVVAVAPHGESTPVTGFTKTLAAPASPSSPGPSRPTTHSASATIAPFARGSSALSRSLTSQVSALGWRIIADGSRRITVVGYTDSTDSPGANLALGRRRAAAVASLLRSDLSAVGWSPVVVTVGTRGASSPVASNSTPAGRARNRRVVVTFTFTS
ncbi:MAG TPA: OmpA family protein [Acidimicrobiales bacterium]|nr:OmpA family protein [Acidimicrobiales bacterium]